MAKEIDKIIQSKTAPKSNNVLWDDGENLKINRNGVWENTNKNAGGEIDPVVWKYLCNPIILTDGSRIPLELIDEDTITFKYKIPGIYKLRIEDGDMYNFNIYNCTHYDESDCLGAHVGAEQNYQINIIMNPDWDDEMSEDDKYEAKVSNDI